MAKKQIPNWVWVAIVVLVVIVITKIDIGDLKNFSSNSFIIQEGKKLQSCSELCADYGDYPVGFSVNSKQECIAADGKSYVTQRYKELPSEEVKCCCDTK